MPLERGKLFIVRAAVFALAGRLAGCVALVLAVACAAQSPYSIHGLGSREVSRAWRVSPAPTPIGGVVLLPGETRRVPIRGACPHDWTGISFPRPHEPNPPHVLLYMEAPDALRLEVPKDATGSGIINMQYRLADGGTFDFALPYLIRPYPVVSFAYAPKPGTAPNRAFVAGAFNGWSNSKNEMTRGADAVFRLDLPVPAGTHSYKFVVDGEWMADPANPKTDGSGHGNSVLVVEGPAEESLEFAFLASSMPGSGPQGAFRLVSPSSARLAPPSVRVILNNRLLPESHFTVDADTGTVRLAAPAGLFLPENFLVVYARDTEGRAGIAQARADYPAAPRSPRDEVLYYAFTDRFHNGDPANDPAIEVADLHPLANYSGGDWTGIRGKIEEGYFDRLGVTTIWISPANRNTMKIERDALPPHRLFSSYHAYWPVSFDETHPPFGTARELAALVDSAHERRIAVLLDYVANHVHQDHPLLREHPGWVTPNKTPDGRPNIRLFDEYPYTTWFDDFLPTLDYDTQSELFQIMSANACDWLDSTGADGFRFDAVKHINPGFWRALSFKLEDRYGTRRGETIFQIGETISDRNTINQFVGPDMLTGQFDFPLLFSLQNAFARGDGSMADVARAALQSQADYPPYAVMSPLIGNHDVVRFMGLADGDIPPGANEKEIGFANPPRVDDPASYRRLRAAFAFIFALPGPPTIYYGDEIGLTGAHDPDNRRPMIWEGWSEEQQATFEAVARLAHARADSLALRRGVLQAVAIEDERIAFARVAPGGVVLAVFFRRPPAADWRLKLPEHWGNPTSFVPLAADGLILQGAEPGMASLAGPPWSYGLFEIRW